MPGYRIVSTDTHIFEPPDLWLSRIEPKFRDRAPRIVRQEDGTDWWVCGRAHRAEHRSRFRRGPNGREV